MSSRITNNSLPCGWCHATIGDLIAPFENANPSHSDRDTFQYVDIDAIDNGEHRITNVKGLPTSKAPSRARKVIRTGDVLISLVRPYLKNIAIVPDELDEQWASTAFCVCRPYSGLDSRFFYYMFLQNDFLNALPTYGDSPPSGHDDDLLATKINLPPADEIVRIADRIDELLTDLSAGVAALERVKRNLSRYRAAVLHAAVTGRLTEAWRKKHGPAEEPGPKLLERILTERRRQWERRTLAKYEKNGKKPPKNWKNRYPEPVEPRPLPDGSPLPMLPKDWCWATHDQVGDVQLGRQRSPQHHHGKHMRPYLRVANVYEDRIDTSDVLEMNFTQDEYEVYALQYGDILLNEGQSMELVGRPAMYRDELPGGCFQNTLVRQRPLEGLLPEFTLAVCRAQFRAGRFRQIASITTSIAHLGAQRFAALEFPLPPEREQAAIIEVVNEKLSQIDALEAEVNRGLRRSGRMRQAILKAAFEGKLVPQDPSDEPANVLLERIHEEAAAAEPKPSRPKKKRPRKKKSSRKTTAK